MVVEGDVVLVYVEGKPAFFARIEAITPDFKPQWFQVKMLVLQVPLMVITWILRRSYVDGVEFTMGGRPVKITKVVSPEPEETGKDLESDAESPVIPGEETPAPKGKGKVVSLADRRKKDHSS